MKESINIRKCVSKSAKEFDRFTFSRFSHSRALFVSSSPPTRECVNTVVSFSHNLRIICHRVVFIMSHCFRARLRFDRISRDVSARIEIARVIDSLFGSTSARVKKESDVTQPLRCVAAASHRSKSKNKEKKEYSLR